MKKTIFLLTGFGQETNDPEFKWMRPYFSDKGFDVHVFAPKWKRRVMSEYVQEFENFYDTHKSTKNYVLGFSFGAMIAYISSPKTKPASLFLCSLSPYFKEDLEGLTPEMRKTIGARRYNDFVQYSSRAIASLVPTKDVHLFYGEAEASEYPQLKKRCDSVHKALPKSKLHVVKDAPHHIDHPAYVEAIKHVV